MKSSSLAMSRNTQRDLFNDRNQITREKRLAGEKKSGLTVVIRESYKLSLENSLNYCKQRGLIKNKTDLIEKIIEMFPRVIEVMEQNQNQKRLNQHQSMLGE